MVNSEIGTRDLRTVPHHKVERRSAVIAVSGPNVGFMTNLVNRTNARR